MTHILDVIESGDQVPDWYENDWVLVCVKSHSAYGYEMTTRCDLSVN